MTTTRPGLALTATLLTLALSACSSTSTGSTTPSTTSTASTAASAVSTATVGTARIVIKNFMFNPATTAVHPGDTITVVNDDTTAHTLTASDKSFDTGTIAPGKSATLTAPAKPGSYPYICTIHQFMHGTLTVS
ncbi:cupredoxin domain-containing protein [Streptomyces rubellomurinus]|uniref:cupredoxin domain-containing protein n=1 Tax=Streptomyces rubellomurinus (strain ATCC 31215) TaxID=359131 RepID=UPI000A7D4667|nr:cupredoxin domain-containing protein [Streptomyces rubellomurinus]